MLCFSSTQKLDKEKAMHKIPEQLVAVGSRLLKSIIKSASAGENKRRDNGSNDDDDDDDKDEASNIVTLDPLTTIMRLATLHLRPKGTKLSFTKYSMLFDLPTVPIHWQGIWRTISSFSGIHSCRNDIAVLKNTILAFRTNSNNTSNTDDTTTVRHAKFTSAAIKGLTKLKQCYDESPDDPIVHCIEFYIALLKEPPRSPMLTSLTSSSSTAAIPSISISNTTITTTSTFLEENSETTESAESAETSESSETSETKGDEKKEGDEQEVENCEKLWSESKEVLIYRLLIEAETQDTLKNYTTVHTLINSIDLLLADADRELERILKK